MPRQKTRPVERLAAALADTGVWAAVDALHVPTPHEGEPARLESKPLPAIEVLASGTDHNTTVIRDRAINLRDNLVRVCDGERLDRARELLNRAVAVALGKD